MEILIEEWIFR